MTSNFDVVTLTSKDRTAHDVEGELSSVSQRVMKLLNQAEAMLQKFDQLHGLYPLKREPCRHTGESGNFCGKCGTHIGFPWKGCVRCRVTVPAENTYCSHCGSKAYVGED